MSNKISYKDIQKIFTDAGSELLTNVNEYYNTNQKIKCICIECRKEYETTVNSFKKSLKKCKKCAREHVSTIQRKSWNEIVELFKSKNHIIITTQENYKNTEQKLKFKCGNCKRISEMSITQCRKSKKYCGHCSPTRKFTFQEVRDYFKSQGCILLSTKYTNRDEKLKYLCSCGNTEPDFKSYKTFKDRNQRCHKCTNARKKKTCMIKYGDENYNNYDLAKSTKLEKYGDIYYRNPEKTKITNLEKYGSENIFHVQKFKEQAQKTMLDLYGVPFYVLHDDFQKKSIPKRLENGNKTKVKYSKESQIIFWEVYKQLPPHLQEKTYFAELNKEYNILSNGRIYAYDFVISSLNKCIEYNGSKFHPAPLLEDSETNWFPFDTSLTAGEKREEDNKKIKALKDERGYDTLVVWDFEKDHSNIILEYLGV